MDFIGKKLDAPATLFVDPIEKGLQENATEKEKENARLRCFVLTEEIKDKVQRYV